MIACSRLQLGLASPGSLTLRCRSDGRQNPLICGVSPLHDRQEIAGAHFQSHREGCWRAVASRSCLLLWRESGQHVL